MKSPKGFGKKYFTFGSVLAHSVEHKILSLIVKIDYLLTYISSKEEEELDENDPPLDIYSINLKPYHCNCYFKVRTRLILLLNHYIPRCPYYTTYFAFRRSGVHPPYLFPNI